MRGGNDDDERQERNTNPMKLDDFHDSSAVNPKESIIQLFWISEKF